jgi:hypothetical protein
MSVALLADGVVRGIARAVCMGNALILGTLTIEGGVFDACP